MTFYFTKDILSILLRNSGSYITLSFQQAVILFGLSMSFLAYFYELWLQWQFSSQSLHAVSLGSVVNLKLVGLLLTLV